MIVLILLGMAGIVIACCVVWATIELIKISRSMQRDNKRYLGYKESTLSEISIHLQKLHAHDESSDSNTESDRRRAIRSLESLYEYIQTY